MATKLLKPKKVERVSSAKLESDKKVARYLTAIAELYDQIETWSRQWGKNVQLEYSETTVNEPAPGAYTAPVMRITLPHKSVVEIQPMGCYLIGAEGRVDVVSRIGKETLLFIPNGGSTIEVRIVKTNQKSRSTNVSSKSDTADGWVWAQNRLLELMPTLNADLMLRLIEVLGR